MRCRITLAAVLLCWLAYAIARYNVLKGVSFEQLPLYVANKAVASAGLILIGIAGLVRSPADRKWLGTAGCALTGLHVVMSLPILRAEYFAGLFREGGRLTWQAELSLLAGAAGTLFLVGLLQVSSKTPAERQHAGRSLVPGLGRLVLLCTALHVALIGYPNWAAVGDWPGGLPPITLLTFVAAIVFIAARRVRLGSTARTRTPELHRGAMQTSGDFDEPLPDEFWTGQRVEQGESSPD